MRINVGRRVVWLSAIALLLMLSLVGRLVDLQVIRSAQYTQMAHQQRSLTLPVGDRRGAILDRNGVELTDPQSSWGVAIFPPLVRDAAGTARTLSPLVGASEAALRSLIEGKREPVWAARQMSAAGALSIQRLSLPGVVVAPAGERYGPAALARHLLGYFNSSGGQLGLEQAFDHELAGAEVPTLAADLTGTGTTIAGMGIREVLPTRGKEPYQVETTLDARVQQAVERSLDEYQGKVAAVVVEPNTGEVLAMASRPQFDYGTLGQLLGSDGGQDFLLNRAVAAYEPGSVFKAIVAAAALETHKVRPDELFFCPGHYDIGGYVFHDHIPGGHGWITFQEAVAQSCNVTFLQVGVERLGVEKLRETALLFGFGAPTGVLGRDWPNEGAGTIPDPHDDGALQMAFGQGGLTTTPLQIARAYSAIANGGTLPALKVVTKIKNPAGEVMMRPPAGKAKRIISRETASQLQKLLAGVTDPGGKGTGRAAWVGGAGSAGKTGTAEAKDKDGHDVTHAWFAGFLPVKGPRYVVVVMAEAGGQGGIVAAPIFRAIGERLMKL